MVFGFIVGILSNWMGLGFTKETFPKSIIQMISKKTSMEIFIRSKSRNDWLLVFVLTFLAFGLRWPGIDAALSSDEATSFLMFSESSWQSLVLNYQDPNQHTLFSLLSNISQNLFGESELIFRMPALLAGILAVPLIYFFSYQCTNSRLSAFLPALLLALSGPHIKWSQLGRGYTLTILLALLVMLSVFKLIKNSNNKTWGLLLIASSFGMVLALPSNIYFVFACSLFFTFMMIRENKQNSETRLKDLACSLIPIFALFGFIIAYFIFIYTDLKVGLESYRRYALVYEGAKTIEFNWNRIGLIARELVNPWGEWFYLAIFLGGWYMKRIAGICFLIILLVPLLGAWVMGVLGPPRSFLYWIPLVMIMAGCGIIGPMARIGRIVSPQTRYAVTALLSIFLLISPFLHLKDYYFKKNQENEKRKTSLIREAKEALSFIEDNTLEHELVVFPYSDRVLRRYIEELVAHKMLRIFQEGRFDKIVFMGNRSVPPGEIPDLGIDNIFSLPKNGFIKIREVGELLIYDFDYQIFRMYPNENYLDFENKIPWPKTAGISFGIEDNHKLTGRHSMVVRKDRSESIKLYSEQIKTLKLAKGGGYTLLIYSRREGSKSYLGLAFDRKVLKPVMLNLMFGFFREMKTGIVWHRISPHYRFLAPPDSAKEFSWQIVLFMVPLDADVYFFKEMMHLKNQENYFDGIQMYVLPAEKVVVMPP